MVESGSTQPGAVGPTERSGAVRPADAGEFFTCQNPAAYFPDWSGFYREALVERAEVCDRFPHELNLKYGPDPYQLADVFHPGISGAAPVVVFFHGGRWREGHPAFYDHFAAPWVEAGAVFVSCGYRLEPAHTIADAVDDAVAALAWVAAHARNYGGDPDRITVAGHSSGGHLAAMAALTDWSAGPPGGTVVGAVCLSAPTDLRTRGVADAERLSPALRVTRAPAGVVVSFGDPEPNRRSDGGEMYVEHGQLLAKALDAAGLPVRTVSLGPADHLASATVFADPDSPLFHAAHDVVFGRA
ncbi:MAG TPA: alpha/beta hydrolase [Pseudonocardia sp.]|nr:alpha/beta hydrolase [Pseudonocardia sp.]